MKKDYDAIIIGAGIIGCCTAFELSKKGFKTLNIDLKFYSRLREVNQESSFSVLG